MLLPCGPTSSLHPRSIVREDRNKEEIKESAVENLCVRSVKNHCRVRALCVFLLDPVVTRCLSISSRSAVPVIVTMSGSIFGPLGSTTVGAIKMNFAKNHPDNIVPVAKRSRAPLRLGFSSSIGESVGIVGWLKKQNSIIRKL